MMAEVILSELVPPILQVLFEKIVTKAEKAVKGYLLKKKKLKELPETIKRWKKNLGEIELVLRFTKQQQFQREDFQVWLNDVQDWAYDLEDILDAFATELRLKDLNSQSRDEEDDESTPSCSRQLIPYLKVPSFLTSNSEASNFNSEAFLTKLNDISNRFQAIQSRLDTLNLLQQPIPREEWQNRQAQTSSLPSPIVFGREEEKRTLIHQLLTDEQNYGNYIVIPIVGAGGIGKTTLAQSVYNNDDERMKGHFGIKAWVCVSSVFDVHQITTAIINAVSDCKPFEFSNLNEAQIKLQNILSGERFLIVLDDVWNKQYVLWEQLQAPFQGGLKGSRVIVTTRIGGVARTMMTTPTTQSHGVNLQGLSNNECWNICKKHALINDDPSDEIRNQVIELSKGLPLAAKALGGLLKRYDRCRWSTILKSTIWSEETGVLPALRLSYYHLPHHLKRVFSYCSVFPKDYEMHEETIVLMWMAEGFLPESDTESMESMGHSYFADLVSRSLFEPRSRRGKRYFVMHNLIHDLAQWVAGDVCCIIQTDRDHVKDRTRFLSITDRDCLSEDKVGDVGKNLRTFAFWGYDNDFKWYDPTFRRFQCLRVLCIPCKGNVKLPSYIGNLKHLRLLDLSMNELEVMPKTMSMLCNLQSLVLKHCRNLTKVLINMECFVDLRHLDFEGSDLREMPSGFGKLTNLRTSRHFIIRAKSGSRICELEKLKYLSGSLDIVGLENVEHSKDAQSARMHEKFDLEILRMYWGTLPYRREDYQHMKLVDVVQRDIPGKSSIEKDVLNKLQPPQSIKELVLDGYMGIGLPDWFLKPSFNMMVVIRLKGCSKCERLPQLGQLPALEELEVRNMNGIKIIGLEFYGDGCLNPFPKLKKIKIKSMKHLQEWSQPSQVIGNKAFPHLEILSIKQCPLLQGNTPSSLPSLKILHVMWCNKLKVTLPKCPLLEELISVPCKELFSIEPVIRCSRKVSVFFVSTSNWIERFWVPDIGTFRVVQGYYEFKIRDDALKNVHITMERCSKQLTWKPYFDLYAELTNLTMVTLGNCMELNKFLGSSKFPASLRSLTLFRDDTIKHISELTEHSTSLEELRIQGSSLITISNLPLTLQVLAINRGTEIKQPTNEWRLDLLTSLRILDLNDVGSSTNSIESIPDPNELPLPSSLVELSIFDFINLKFISCSTLPNLAKLRIQGCPNITREDILVPQGFVFNTRDGKCKVDLQGFEFQRP